MKHSEQKNGRGASFAIHAEAGEWLHRLLDTEYDPEEPFPNLVDRQRAFFRWLGQTAAHGRAFYEILEVERRTGNPDPEQLINVEELLKSAPANVIQLYEGFSSGTTGAASSTEPPGPATQSRRTIFLGGIAAAVAMCAIVGGVYFSSLAKNTYTTAIGEQRTCKLRDGSVVVLNTDTQVQVDFSHNVRSVRLLKGEALFMVEHDASRPFIVSAGSAHVRAVGTEFNVRRRGEETTEVAVVEGVVQVSTANTPVALKYEEPAKLGVTSQPEPDPSPAALRLAAGERAQVFGRGMKVSESHDLEDVLAWRQRRLTFRGARLADVAAEFNRYNRSQIRVEGAVAQAMQMTGIFDADHPQAIILFAQKNDSLNVRPEGENWIIRSRP